MRTRLLAALFLALIGLGGTAYRTDAARVIVCPSGCAFSSIQAAIDAAPVGAAIKIKPGTYAEQVTISKDLTLSGSGADTTVIDGGGANVVTATFQVTATLSGLTITNGGTGLRNDGATLTVKNSRIVNNRDGGVFHQGVLSIENSVISGNSTESSGGGIFNNESTLSLRNTLVAGNSAAAGGGIYLTEGHITLDNSRVQNNRAANDGGGIVSVEATVTLNASEVSGNAAGGNGGGISSYAGSSSDVPVTLNSSTVAGNTASGDGGGIHNNAGIVRLANSAVTGNRAVGNGGGILNTGDSSQLYSTGVLELSNSRVTGNSATSGGGIYNVPENTVTLTKSRVSGNIPDDCTGLDC
jgi:hypothetical protein